MLTSGLKSSIKEWAGGNRYGFYAASFLIVYFLSELYLGTIWSPDLDRILLVRLGAILFLAVSIAYPDILLGFFLSSSLTFLFMLLAPSLNLISGWSILPPLAIGLYLVVRGKKISLPLGPVVYAQIGVSAMLLLGLLYTREYEDALEKVWAYSYNNLVPFLCLLLFAGDEKRVRNVMLSFWGGVLVWAVGGPFVLTERPEARLWPDITGPIGYGRIAGLAVIFVIWVVISVKGRPVVKAALVPVGLWVLYNMVATGVRGVLVAFIIAAVLMVQVGFGRMVLIKSCVINLLVMIVLGWAIFYAPRESMERLVRADLYRAELSSVSEQDRRFLYREAWRMFLGSPLIGWGTSSFVEISNYPHNIFLEVAVEGGLIGLSIFATWVFMSLRYAWLLGLRTDDRDMYGKMGVVLFGSFVFILAEAQFSLDIIGNRMLWVLSGVIWAVYSGEAAKGRG